MFSDNSKYQADACRFCWMCRHICPVGQVTGKEGNTPRGKGFIVSMDSRNIPFNEDAAGVMYECCLCEACSNDCVTGYEPPVFIREARTLAAVNGYVPKQIQKVIDAATKGSLYDAEPNKELITAIEKLPRKADTLLYIGDVAAHQNAQSAMDLMSVLEAAKVEFTALVQEPSTGSHLADLIGYVDDVRQVAKACVEEIMKTGAKTLVVMDPSDARFIKQQWGEWGLLEDVKTVTATSFVASLVESGALKLKQLSYKDVTFHDPCRLARGLDETEVARDLIKAMGISLQEMFLNRKLARCCSGAVLRENHPEISSDIADKRWEDAAEVGAKTIITACPACHYVLGSSKPEENGILDIYSLLAQAAL